MITAKSGSVRNPQECETGTPHPVDRRAGWAVAALSLALAACQSAPEPVLAPKLPPPPIAAIGHTGLDPQSGGAPTKVVVLFHGEGQSAESMRPLAQALAPKLPDTLFVFDDGLVRSGDAYSWYRASGADISSRQLAYNHATRLVATLSNIYAVPPSRIVTVGFSQGAELAIVSASCTSPVSSASVAVASAVAERCKNDEDPALLIVADEDASGGSSAVSHDAASTFVLEQLR